MESSRNAALSNFQTIYRRQGCDSSNYREFDKKFRVFGEKAWPAFPHGLASLYETDVEWNGRPDNIRQDGTIKPRLVIPDMPEDPQMHDGTAAAERIYMTTIANNTRTEKKINLLSALQVQLIEILTDQEIFGARVVAHVLVTGDVAAQALLTPIDMRATLQQLLGRPDAIAVEKMYRIYEQPVDGEQVFEHIFKEDVIHKELMAFGLQCGERERVRAIDTWFGMCPAVMTCMAHYKVAFPNPVDQTFERMTAYIITQEHNIRSALTRKEVGYSAQAKVYTELEVETMLTARLEKLTATMFANQGSASGYAATGAPTKCYCYSHGTQWFHNGAMCTTIQPGKYIIGRRFDSRPLDRTRVFDHRNCKHTPKCITSADAKAATSPTSFPGFPGNANVHCP